MRKKETTESVSARSPALTEDAEIDPAFAHVMGDNTRFENEVKRGIERRTSVFRGVP